MALLTVYFIPDGVAATPFGEFATANSTPLCINRAVTATLQAS
jgi:hypothetical protein